MNFKILVITTNFLPQNILNSNNWGIPSLKSYVYTLLVDSVMRAIPENSIQFRLLPCSSVLQMGITLTEKDA